MINVYKISRQNAICFRLTSGSTVIKKKRRIICIVQSKIGPEKSQLLKFYKISIQNAICFLVNFRNHSNEKGDNLHCPVKYKLLMVSSPSGICNKVDSLLQFGALSYADPESVVRGVQICFYFKFSFSLLLVHEGIKDPNTTEIRPSSSR